MADTLRDGTAYPMGDDICLVFSSDTFGFVKGYGLLPCLIAIRDKTFNKMVIDNCLTSLINAFVDN
jgi:hypothetical protein